MIHPQKGPWAQPSKKRPGFFLKFGGQLNRPHTCL